MLFVNSMVRYPTTDRKQHTDHAYVSCVDGCNTNTDRNGANTKKN